ncbi:MAG: anthranilate synthase component I [Crenarchaeota archaeon]|nr:anthranilate synthase component I [Thermoproteota archaeon]
MRKLPIKQVPEPIDLLRYLVREVGASDVVLLESRQGHHERARFTFIMWEEEDRYVHYPEDTSDARRKLKEFLSRCDDSPPGMKLAVGYLSYEACTLVEPYLRDHVSDWGSWPLVEMFSPKYVVVYDNMLGRVYSNTEIPREALKDPPEREGVRILEEIESVGRETYEDWVRKCLENIYNGEVFQIVISRWITYRISGDLITMYENLRELNPSPYMYFYKLGDKYIIGTSPELLVKVDNHRVETHPIAGTRPRGRTEEEDIMLEDELLRSEKDRAEHIMLVDLARNDLGKICRFGTVRVTELFVIEKYSHVQHLVSKVEGTLLPGMDIVDALWATFPAGTVSGAPKPRAMELIFEYERRAREPYAGAVGLSYRKFGEFAIIIRSAIINNDKLTIRAGAGIVADSKPELEYLETEHKLGALKDILLDNRARARVETYNREL